MFHLGTINEYLHPTEMGWW